MADLTKSMEEIQNRIKFLEAQIQEIREMLPKDVVSYKLPWEVVEIEKVMKQWYSTVKQGVIVTASRDEKGGWVNTSMIKTLTDLPMDKVVFLLSPFSNEQRLKVLLQLCKHPKSATDLSNETGLQGGQLYHHLDTLIKAKYLEKPYKGKYCLTNIGRWALYSVLHIAQHLGQLQKQEDDRKKTRAS